LRRSAHSTLSLRRLLRSLDIHEGWPPAPVDVCLKASSYYFEPNFIFTISRLRSYLQNTAA
jgi:hypothetical protein